jgi:hypothetical protein
MLIARHAVSSVFTIQIIKPVQIAAKWHADTVLADLYVKQKLFLHLYCTGRFPDDNPTDTVRRSWNSTRIVQNVRFVFVWIAKTLRNWYRINRTRRILSR